MTEGAAGPLSGLRVLEVGGAEGAWCGKLLADMGATVVKIEPREGDPTRACGPFYQDTPGPNNSLYFWHYNTNKKSITLDLSSASSQGLFRRLAASVDVLIDSYPPGHLDRLGVGYAALRKGNPRLIMAAITPFGQDGPYRDYAATDLTILAFGGPAWSCGYDDHSVPPMRGGGNQGYHVACHWAAISIMIALLHRNRSGEGQFIDVNMHAAANVTTEGATYNWMVNRSMVQRQTGRHASSRSTRPSQVLCGDGRYLNTGISLRSEGEWMSMLAWLNENGVLDDLDENLAPPSREALAKGDPEALEAIRRVSEAVEALALKRKDGLELFQEAQERGFQWGIIYSPDEVMEDPHFQARGFVVEVEHLELGKTFRYPGAPYRFTVSPWAVRRRAPLLGEDNQTIYGQELGLTPEEMAALARDGVIYGL